MADFIYQKISFSGDKEQIKDLIKLLEVGKLMNSLRPMPEELNFDSDDHNLRNAVIGKVYRGFRGVWDDLDEYETISANKAKNVEPELFQKYKENYEKHGHCTWYTWRIEKWGTKWDAHIKKIGKTFFVFGCAWSQPTWVIEELSSKFDKINFELKKVTKE